MTSLLDMIQEELALIAEDLDRGRIDDAKSGLHYIHAFIETEKTKLIVDDPVAA